MSTPRQRTAAYLIARIDIALAEWAWTADAVCLCRHEAGQHEDYTGRCLGADSYGCPCACPSLEEDTGD